MTIGSASFVGLGEDPQVLAIRAPELFGVSHCVSRCANGYADPFPVQLIASTYPDVVQGVPRV